MEKNRHWRYFHNKPQRTNLTFIIWIQRYTYTAVCAEKNGKQGNEVYNILLFSVYCVSLHIFLLCSSKKDESLLHIFKHSWLFFSICTLFCYFPHFFSFSFQVFPDKKKSYLHCVIEVKLPKHVTKKPQHPQNKKTKLVFLIIFVVSTIFL